MNAKSCPIQARCVGSLLASPQLSPLFFGLTAEDGQLVIDADKFVCCQGSGVRFDAQLNAVRRCNLIQRRKLLEELLRYMQMCWPGFEVGNLNAVAKLMTNEAQAKWTAFLTGGRQAWAFRVDPYKGPSWLWAAAGANIWRKGGRSQVLSFSSPRFESMQISGYANPEIIFVEGIQKLIDPRRALILEEIIAHAYNANIRLVMEFTHEAAPAVDPEAGTHQRSFSTKGSLANRVARLKRQDPLLFLEPNTRSRLQSMCLSPRIS